MIWLWTRYKFKQNTKAHRALVGCLAEIARKFLVVFERSYPTDRRLHLYLSGCELYAKGKVTSGSLRPLYRDAREALRIAEAAVNDAYYAANAALDVISGNYIWFDCVATKSKLSKRACAEIVRKYMPTPTFLPKCHFNNTVKTRRTSRMVLGQTI